MRRALAVLAVLVLAGCGASGGSDAAPTTTYEEYEPPPPCEQVYKDGAVTTESMVDAQCEQTQGETIKSILVPGMSVNECKDGRLLLWNDLGWGYVGEPWHSHPVDAEEQVAPQADIDACDD